jgi:hypothetical protein
LISEQKFSEYLKELCELFTLTAKSVNAKHLNKRMIDTKRALRILLNRLKKRHQRGQGIKVMVIKSLECNFNPVKRTYSPHFHLIVPNMETAQLLNDEWLNLWTRKFANKKGQDIKIINGLGRALT